MFWTEERGRLVDWWDRKHQESEAILDVWVGNNPSTMSIMVAGSTATMMRLGSGMVDVLRLGQGIKQGGIKGYTLDILRLLSIAGPAFKGAGAVITRLIEVRLPFSLLAPLSADLGVCSWVASTQAMRMTGRLFITIDDLLKISGFPNLKFLWANRTNISYLENIGAGAGTFLRDIVGGMRSLGSTVLRLGNPTTMQAVEAATLSRRNGVVLFNVKWEMGIEGVGIVRPAHTLIAFRNALGQFRILDRSGRVVQSLFELDQVGYRGIMNAIPYDEMYFVADTIVTQISGALSTIAMEVSTATNSHK